MVFSLPGRWLAVSLGALLACSSSSSEPSTANDGGGADGGGVGSSTETKQTGRAAVVQTATPIPGAVVSAGGAQATADADGNYAITVPRGKPITLKLSAPDHLQLIEQEYIVDTPSYARGDSLLIKTATARLLAAFLPGYDEAKGLLAVKVVPMTGCATEGGTTLTLDPPGAELKYTKGGLPDSSTSVTAGENNGALFYNVTPRLPVKVTATHPTCKQLPFPVEYQGVKYTGVQTTEPGESFSFVRVFLGPGT
jgi:hypothetical protein